MASSTSNQREPWIVLSSFKVIRRRVLRPFQQYFSLSGRSAGVMKDYVCVCVGGGGGGGEGGAKESRLRLKSSSSVSNGTRTRDR